MNGPAQQTENAGILVTAVIPAKNGGSTLRACLEALFAQTLSDRMEVILIDSGSTDDTLKIAGQYPVRLLQVEASIFNHGLTRNKGTEIAKGEFVYFTVQDASLSATDSLERMIAHFQDGNVMGVCGRQGVPWHTDKNPLHWHRPVSEPAIEKTQFAASGEFAALSPRRQSELSAWDNVNALYRKSALIRQPFIKADFAEDMFWAKSALEKGWALVQDSGILVWHYHHRDFRYAFKVTFILHYSVYLFFGVLPVYPSFYQSLRIIPVIVLREKTLGLRARFYWLFHSLAGFLGSVSATRRFRKVAKTGEAEKIREAYERYCGKVPMGRLKGQA